MTPESPRATVKDPAYLAFLEERLPLLARHRVPWWRRSWRSKHDTLRYCLGRVPIDPNGLIAEFGVYRGTTIRMMARRFPDRQIYGFDSFEGFPEDGRKDWRQDFSTGGRLPEVPANVVLSKGFFEDTLPGFVAAHAGEHLALLHIDCDLYSSTRTVFRHCAPMIRPGCVVVFDELLHYPECLDNEIAAFWEFLRDSGADFEWVATGGGVLPVSEYLAPSPRTRAFMNGMAGPRAAGYDPAVAVRIIAPR